MFGDILKSLRVKAGITQAQLAAASGISLGSVRNLEQGIRQPTWDTVQRLAHALGEPYDSFANADLHKKT
jgi:transcriptional regulator with XRE-family HTH domain